MDDDKFRKELLNRMDKIISLLALSCAIANGSIEKSKAESALRHLTARGDESAVVKPPSIDEEMDDIYRIALEKYRERGAQ